jgi:hypothetical protein
MKFFKHGLRLMITGGSVAGFLGGWVLLSHSPKPVPAGSASSAAAVEPLATELPTLAPLPSLDNGNFSPLQPLPSLPQASFQRMPRFRTGGS